MRILLFILSAKSFEGHYTCLILFCAACLSLQKSWEQFLLKEMSLNGIGVNVSKYISTRI